MKLRATEASAFKGKRNKAMWKQRTGWCDVFSVAWQSHCYQEHSLWFFPSKEDQTHASSKRSPSFQPTLLMLEYFHSTMASTGQQSTISISWCQMLERDGTDIRTGGLVYVGRDLWTRHGLSNAQRKADFKFRLPRALLIFTAGRQQGGPLCLFSGQHVCTEICFSHV